MIINKVNVTPKKSSAGFGSPILPGCEPRLLVPIVADRGTFQVFPDHGKETHVLRFNGQDVASHANGYSVHALAERTVKAWETGDFSRAVAQLEYIVACGGRAVTVTTFLNLVGAPH